eukprot:GHVS01028168.1.p1 GENE.GHVS01028168.1~~GHVS01028168.1.p1  ORF type:complete len:249 (+),score=32.76 GHVS01028168.1:89-835(+)
MLAFFKETIVLVMMIACACVSIVASSSEPLTAGSPSSVSATSAVITLTDANFEHDTQVASGATTGDWFVLFHSPNCGHCHRVMPVWEELGDVMKGQMNVAKLDVSANPETSGRFGIRGIPVLALFRHGKMYKFAASSERSLKNLREFAEGGYDQVAGETVPKVQAMLEVAKEFVQRHLADANVFLEQGLAGTKQVHETLPHVVYFTAGAGALAAIMFMMLLKLCCWAMCSKSAAAQVPTSKRRTHKKD